MLWRGKIYCCTYHKNKYIYLKWYLLRCYIIPCCLLPAFGVIIFLSLIAIGWFLFMYSFIVGPQVTVCRRIVSALDPNRFDVTLESFLFVMWYLNFVLLLKDLSHKLQGDSIFVWTSRLWSLRRVSLENCLPQKLHTSSELIFLKYVSFCCY